MALFGSFFVVCFLAFFTNWFYMECKKHGFLKRFIGWIDKLVTKNKDKIQKYGWVGDFCFTVGSADSREPEHGLEASLPVC